MLNENLKQLRRAKGFSQEDLAMALNVVRQTVSKWEKGFSVPDADLLLRIAEVLDAPVNEKLESRYPGLYIIGDGSGITHSLSHDSASGIHVARNIVNK